MRTAFDNNGSASGTVSGDVISAETGTTTVSATFAAAGTFQPVADDWSAGGGGAARFRSRPACGSVSLLSPAAARRRSSVVNSTWFNRRRFEMS
jgi:hypothetical protein